jgi:hypothetical protein
MAISGPASYLPTLDEFLEHWLSSNNGLPPASPLVVGQPNPAGGPPVMKSRSDLDGLKSQLTTTRGAVTLEAVTLAVKRGDVRDRMGAVLARFNQFASAVRSRYQGKAFERALPPAPAVGDAPETFLKSIEKAGVLWASINTFQGSGGPLQLGQGSAADPFYTVAMFNTDTQLLQTAASDVHRAEGKLKTALELRNDVQDLIKPILRDYRQAVAGRFAEGHALVESMPRFSPAPGNNPARPQVNSAQWNGTENRAEVNFTPSTDPDVVRHELRVVPGGEYDEELEVIAATLVTGQPSVFTTTVLLTDPGALVAVKVYAITADGRESASGMVLVQRPA